METYTYICNYCKKEYVPKRRGIQKFCSNSCRSRNHQLENPKPRKTKQENGLGQLKPLPKTKIDKVSFAGVGNSVLGHATFEFGKSVFTPEHKKAATKGDLKNLEVKLVQRYHLVKNMNQHPNGMKPYFDLVKGEVVYRW